MAATRPVLRPWTYRAYRALPDDGRRHEVIDGDLLVSPAPGTTHQRVSKRIEVELYRQLEEAGLGEVFDAPVDVILSDRDVVQPDLLVVGRERLAIVSPRGIEGAPDVVVEILSPSTSAVDRDAKRALYAAYGVVEYWIVDPDARRVEVLRLGTAGYDVAAEHGPTDTLRSPRFPTLSLPLARVFA